MFAGGQKQENTIRPGGGNGVTNHRRCDFTPPPEPSNRVSDCTTVSVPGVAVSLKGPTVELFTDEPSLKLNVRRNCSGSGGLVAALTCARVARCIDVSGVRRLSGSKNFMAKANSKPL